MHQIVFGSITYAVLVSQVIGLFASAVLLWSYQQNTNRRILAFQIIASVLFAASLFFLGAFSGALANIAGIFRNFVFFHRDKKWAQSKAWFYIFCGLFIVCGLVTWQGAKSLLPMFGMITSTVALYDLHPSRTRKLCASCSLFWITYNFITKNPVGVLNECLCITSIIVAIFRYDIPRKHRAAIPSDSDESR